MGILNYFSAKKRFERKISKVYHADIRNAASTCIDNKMLLGIVVFKTIADTYKRIEESKKLFLSSKLDREAYDTVNKNVFDSIGRGYINNWDEMITPKGKYLSDDDRFAEEYEPDF